MKVRFLAWIIALSIFLNHMVVVYAMEENSGQITEESENVAAGRESTVNTDDITTAPNAQEIFSDNNLKQTNWTDITSAKMFLFELEKGVTYRYEVFYDTYTNYPDIILISPTGFIHKPGQSSLYTEKSEQTVSGYHNIKYKALYITSDETGTWKLSITPANGQKFLCVIKTKTPRKWESITQDKKITPEELLTWYTHETVFHDADVKTIVSVEDEKPQSGMQSVDPPTQTETPPEQTSTSGNMTLIYIAVIAGCGIAVLVSQLNKKRKKEIAEKKRQQRIEAANKALAEERKKENERLAEIILQHEAEYIDYPDPTDYYEKSVRDGLQIYPEKHSEMTITEKSQNHDTASTDTQQKDNKTEDTIINYF